MLKFKITLFFVLPLFFVFGQTYENIASQQNVNVYLQTEDNWAVGMSFYDFNEDGWDDLTYVMQNDSVKFYINNNGTFTQIPSFINSIGKMKELLWVDYDNDSDLDIFITYHNLGIRMFQNDGLFNFTDVSTLIGLTSDPMFSYGASFADYDNDGDLDFYVCNYESSVYFSSSPHTNLLYQNNGNGTFTDVTVQAGVGNGFQYSFIGVWLDFNDDGLLDIHLINDRFTTLNALYMNNGNGTFTDMATSAGLTMPFANPMSNSISDFDDDGDYDIFITNTSGATIQNDDYNFMVNQGNGTFLNQLNQYGLNAVNWAWGALWVDYNNDMYEDLLISTGFLIENSLNESPSYFYKNNGGNSFTLLNDSLLFNTTAKSYCPVKGDINNDGFYDIAVHNEGPSNTHIMLNSTNDNHFIKIDLTTSISNYQAIGSEIKVYSGGTQQMKTVFCGDAFCGQNSQHIIFGVGSNQLIDSIVVTFPSGIVKTEYNVSVDQLINIYESQIVYVSLAAVDTLVLCQGSSIEIGLPGYLNYFWNNSETSDSINVSTEGQYFFTAVDSFGNTIISDTLTLLFTNPPSFLPIAQNEDCNASNGLIELIPLWNSTYSYTIDWSNNAVGLINSNITEGWYNYTYSDVNNCAYAFDSIYVSANETFSVEINTSPQTDLSLGTAAFFPFGGVGPFQFFMNGNQINNPLTDLSAGNYLLSVIDANGCEELVPFTIEDAVIGLGIGDLQQKQYFVSYSEGSLTILSNALVNNLTLEIFDVTGKKCFSLSDLTFEKSITLPITLQTGYYQVNLIGSNQISSNSFIVF